MNSNDDFKIDSCFENKFSFQRGKDWILPPIDLILTDELWRLGSLTLLKTELNEAKSLLNDKGEQWHEHTARINKAKLIIETIKDKIHPDILTQAWCKFYEILASYELISGDKQDFKSLHLCEAPGAFISALNCYLYQNHPTISWEWLANTLNPYYEGQNIKNVIVDDRLLFPTLRNWYFGKDDIGDITNPSYQKDITEFLEGKGQFNLVTADGSFNCLDDPAEQESLVAELHFAEMLVALSHLSLGGSFVLKKFTFFESINICKMFFLNCTFEKVHVFKPFTSKHGNSEVYVICMGYYGVEGVSKYLELMSQTYVSKKDRAMFPLSKIPESFISQLVQCSKLFLELQKSAIHENIHLYSQPLSSYEGELYEIQRKCAEKFLQKCNIVSNFTYDIPPLFPSKKQILTSFYDKRNRNCKALYFQALGETFENLEQSKLMVWQDILLDVEKRLNMCFPSSQKRPHEDLEWCFVWKETVNRMKSKSYKNWVSTGKKICIIQNSKFCNPYLMHLWNRISHGTQIKIQDHHSNGCCYWDMEALLTLLIEKVDPEEFCIISMSKLKDENSEEDPIFFRLQQTFNHSYTCNFSNIENEEMNFPSENRILYINTTYWENSLHQELNIKRYLTEVLSIIIKVMNLGDTFIFCIQSLFTRYTIGIIFMMLSLFEKFVCILPNDVAPATCGQLWVFNNFRKTVYTDRLINHLETIVQLDVPDTNEVLQIVPIASLCGGHFYEFLLTLNNSHMQQRLRSLILIEKDRLKKAVCTVK